MDKELFVHTFLNGFQLPVNKDELSIEEKLIVTISKQLKDITLITENVEDFRREMNIRGVLLAANKSGVEHSILREYVKTFYEQSIYIVGEDKELKSYFQKEGLTQIQSIARDEVASSYDPRSIFLISEKELSYIHDVKSNKYLVYSLENLRVGPLLIPGTTICLTCYGKKENVRERDFEAGYPIFYRNFILNFLVNSVYFSLNDIHKYLGMDVGIPIRKCYQLAIPELSVSVTNIYKTTYCTCFEESLKTK